MKTLGVYIHIPFCKRKCPYCSFYSLEYNNYIAEKYVHALCNEIARQGKFINNIVNSIYIGGGTPNLIGSKWIKEILKTIKNNFKLSSFNSCETTIELNPSCHNDIDFNFLKKIGINRLSFGAQSINEKELNILGRSHSPIDVKLAIEKAKTAGFENISIDIIIAAPKQTKRDVLNSLEFCIDNDIPHISLYILKVENGTIYFKNKESLDLPSEDETCDFYLLIHQILTKNGYKHYEISNFCKPNKESVHNLKYWNCDEYLGLGPSSHSFINGKRYCYSESLDDFINYPCLSVESYGGSKEEYVMLRLRLSDGLKHDEYQLKFGENIPEVYFKRASKYIESGLVIIDKSGIKLTAKGFLVSNSLILNIIY